MPHSFSHSFVPLTYHMSSTEELCALINVYPGNYGASRDPGRGGPLAQHASLRLDSPGPSTRQPPCTLKARPQGYPLDSHGPCTAPAPALTTLHLNCLAACLSLAQGLPLRMGTWVCACSVLYHRAWCRESTPAAFAKQIPGSCLPTPALHQLQQEDLHEP